MAPFDGPALAAANDPDQADQREGRRQRPAAPDQDLRHAEQQPGEGEVVRGQPARAGRRDHVRRPATSTSRRRSCRRRSTAACSRSRRASAPTRWGRSASARKGRLAFSFGNVAQDEGSAMAEYAWRKGWRTAALATNTLLVYFKNVVTAFDKRFTQLGGKIVARESYATGANNVNAAVSRLNGDDARRDRHRRRRSASCRRSSRACARSGTRRRSSTRGPATAPTGYPKSPQVTNYYAVTFASVFGDDPNPAVRAVAREKQVQAPGTGGFVTGAAAIDGVVTAIRRAGGSTNGVDARRDSMEKFRKVPTLVGPRQLLAALPHRLRPAVPRDPDREQQGAATSGRSRRRSSRTSSG